MIKRVLLLVWPKTEAGQLPEPAQAESNRIKSSSSSTTKDDMIALAGNFDFFYSRRPADDAIVESMEKGRREKIIRGATEV